MTCGPPSAAEWIKLVSVRATRIFIALTGVIGVGMALILGNVVETDPYDHLPFTIGNTFLVSSWLTTLFAVVAGTLLFTTEVQHGTLAVGLTVRPSKRIIVGAEGRRGSSARLRHGCSPASSAVSPAVSPAAWTPVT